MKVKVYRYDHLEEKEAYFDEFEVPVPKEENWTVMDVLDYIVNHLDSSVSYYKHSVCNHGICGRCLIRVNKKTKLACTALANEHEELVLEPKTRRRVIKDLVTEST